MNWFLSFQDAQEKINQWKWEYNHFRPYSSIENLTPVEFESLYNKENISSDIVKAKTSDDPRSSALTKSPEIVERQSTRDTKLRPYSNLKKKKLNDNKKPEIHTLAISD